MQTYKLNFNKFLNIITKNYKDNFQMDYFL